MLILSSVPLEKKGPELFFIILVLEQWNEFALCCNFHHNFQETAGNSALLFIYLFLKKGFIFALLPMLLALDMIDHSCSSRLHTPYYTIIIQIDYYLNLYWIAYNHSPLIPIDILKMEHTRF